MVAFAAFPISVRTFNQDLATTEALEEIVNLYRQADSDAENTERPLNGSDLMDELGIWIERHHKLLRKLGIVEDTIDIEHD